MIKLFCSLAGVRRLESQIFMGNTDRYLKEIVSGSAVKYNYNSAQAKGYMPNHFFKNESLDMI